MISITKKRQLTALKNHGELNSLFHLT